MRKLSVLMILIVALTGMVLQAAPPETAPILLSPATNSVFNDPSEFSKFEWTSVQMATRYKLIVKDVKSGAKVVKEKIEAGACASTCSFAPLTLNDLAFMKDNGEYSWKVKAINPDGKTVSDASTFSAEFPGEVQLNSPDDDYLVGDPQNIVGFTWTENPYATQYKIIVKHSTTGAKVVSKKIDGTDSFYCNFTCAYYLSPAEQAKFESDAEYRWKVKSINPLGKSTSETRSILTMFN